MTLRPWLALGMSGKGYMDICMPIRVPGSVPHGRLALPHSDAFKRP